jgi:hypothetical protein
MMTTTTKTAKAKPIIRFFSYFPMRVIALLLIVILSGIGLADYTAFSGLGQIDICQGSMAVDTVYLKNTGTEDAELGITSSSWSKHVPSEVRVKPGEQAVVYNFIRPPKDIGLGMYEITTRFDNGVTKELRQIVNIKSCPVTIVSEGETFTDCPCTLTYYEFKITNTGPLPETYALGVNSEYAEISKNPLVIKPNSTESVYVSLQLPCGNVGEYEFTFITQAASGFRTETPFRFISREGCFDFRLEPGKPLLEKTPEFVPQDRDYKICSGRTSYIPVRVISTGELDTKLNYSVDRLPFYGTLNLTKGSEKIVHIPVDMHKGTYDLEIGVKSNKGVYKSESFKVKVEDCNSNEDFPQESSILNKLVFAVLGLIIVFVLFYIFPKEETVKKRRPLAKKWKVVLAMVLALILLVAAVFALNILGIAIIGGAVSLFSIVYSFVQFYWIYFIAGVVLFAIVALFNWRPELFKATSMFFIVIVVAGAIFLLLSVCFYGGICTFVQPEQKAEGISESPTMYIWNKDRSKEIDLSEFIKNPDSDNLIYLATDVDNISVVFEGPIATLTPLNGFYGERIINFIVDDGKGGRAVSPDITLIVLDRQTKPWDRAIGVLARFGGVIMFLVFAAVIVVILMVIRAQRPRKRIVVSRKKKA